MEKFNWSSKVVKAMLQYLLDYINLILYCSIMEGCLPSSLILFIRVGTEETHQSLQERKWSYDIASGSEIMPCK